MATETVELAAAYVQLVPSLKGVEGVIAKALGGSSGPVQEASRSLGQRIVSSISDAVTRSPKVAVAVGKSVASAMAEAGLAGAAVGRVVASAMGDTARIVGVAMGDVGRIAKRTFVDLTPQWVKTGVGLMASLWGAGVGRVSSAWSTATTSIGVSALSVSDRVRSSLGTAYTWVGVKAIDAGGRVSSAWSTATTSIGVAGLNAADRVGRAFSALGASIPGPVREVASVVGRAMGDLGRTAGTAAGQVASVWMGAFSKIAPGVTAALGKVGSAVSTGLQGAFSGIGGKIGGLLSSGASSAVSAAASLGSSMSSAITGAVGVGLNGLGAAVAGAVGVVAANLGGAVERADLINNFPKIMSNIGYSSEEAAGQVQRISDSLDGLPTSTDALVRTAQGLAPITGDLTSATDVALALNNALLAGGASAGLAENAMEQYRQMLAFGKVDMAAWRSMTQAMPGQMDQVAKSILGASGSTSQLYDAMQDGSVSFDDFNAALVSLNGEGIDGMASFADQAKTATGGIGTAFQNAGNRVKKAMASIIEAIGVDQIAAKINEMTSGITGFGERIAGVIDGLKGGGGFDLGGLSGMLPVIGGLAGALGPLMANLPIVGRLFAGLTGPVGLVIGLFGSMLTESDSLRGAFGDVFSALGTVLSGLAPSLTIVGNLFSTIAGVIGDSLAAAMQAVLPALVSVAEKVMPVLESVLTAVAPVLASVVEVVAGIFVQAVQILAPILADLVVTLLPVFQQVIAAIMPPLQEVITAIGGLAQEILPVLGDILGTVVGVLGNVLAAVLPTLASVIGTVLNVLATVIAYVSETVVPVISWVWYNILSPVLTWIGDTMVNLWNSYVKPAWDSISDKINSVSVFMRDTVLPVITGFAGSVKTAFENARDAVKTAWDKIKEYTAKPVNFVIGTVYTDGIKKLVDNITDAVGLDLTLPTISKIDGYASGGVLPGYTPGRDVHLFTSPTGGALALSGGEAIMRPEWVRDVGGPGAVAAMNAAAKRGGTHLSPFGDVGNPRAFKDGGIWDTLKEGVSGAVDWVADKASAVASIISDPLGAVTNLIKKPVDALLASMGWTGTFVEAIKEIPGRIISSFSSWLSDSTASMSGSGLVDMARTKIGSPYVWGAAGPDSFDCSGLVVWSLRQLGIDVPRYTASQFQANSVAVGSGGVVPGDLWFWGGSVGSGGAYHVAISSGDGMMVEAPRPGESVRETPVYGAAHAGRFLYDDGGYLQPGLTVVENRTGRPEMVFTKEQFGKLGNRGFPDRVVLQVRDREFDAYVVEVADGRIVEASRG